MQIAVEILTYAAGVVLATLAMTVVVDWLDSKGYINEFF